MKGRKVVRRHLPFLGEGFLTSTFLSFSLRYIFVFVLSCNFFPVLPSLAPLLPPSFPCYSSFFSSLPPFRPNSSFLPSLPYFLPFLVAYCLRLYLPSFLFFLTFSLPIVFPFFFAVTLFFLIFFLSLFNLLSASLTPFLPFSLCY